MKRWPVLLAALLPVFALAQPSPDVLLLSRIRQHMVRNLTQVPNYTCLQTIERSHRPSGTGQFRALDTVRVEVALVAGKELFSWPGAGRFEEKSLGELVGGGLTTTGDYALHARTVFLSSAPTFTYRGEETRNGRAAVRFDYRVSALVSGYQVQMGEKSAVVPYHGSLWADRETLDLLRLDVEGEETPPEMEVAGFLTQIEYSHTRVGESDFLLPRTVEFLLRRGDGSQGRNRTAFSGCRQYVGESAIFFEEPSPATATPDKQFIQMDLPPGLRLEVRLKTPLDSNTSVTGDPVAAVLAWPLKKDGKILVPKGAEIKGRIRRLERLLTRVPYYLFGLELFEAEWEGTRTRFAARLQEVGPGFGRPGRDQLALLPEQVESGVGFFYVRGARATVPQGLRMVWITEAVDRGRSSP